MRIAPFLVVCFATLFSAQAVELEVVIHGIERIQGNVRVGIYDSKETFRIEPMEQSETIEVTEEVVEEGRVTAILKDLEPGVYAIAVVWDINKNEELDVSGPFKRPVEPTGFSHNPKMLFGPPKYKDCVFTLTEEGGKMEITLQEV